MDNLYLMFVIIVCGWVIMIFSRGQGFLGKAKHRHQSYTLYNIRDRLYWLVADRKLLSESQAFQFIENYLNLAVHYTSHLNVDQLIVNLYEQEIDQDRANELIEWVSSEHEAVSQVYVDIFRATREIIAQNSPIVFWAYRNRHLRGFGRILLRYRIGRYFGLRMMQKALRVIEKLSQMEESIESRRGLLVLSG